MAKSAYPLAPPIEPMLAKLADELPPAGEVLFEPKWDGFRALVFRGEDQLFIQSRDSRPRRGGEGPSREPETMPRRRR